MSRPEGDPVIPKKLHLVWIGPEGTRPDAGIDTWRQANPDWDVQLWENTDLSDGQWTNRDHMRAMLAHDLGAVMTMMRYEILLAEGGIAVDALTLARQPLDEWLRCEDFACWADEHDAPGLISPGLLGAEPGSAFLRRVVDDIHDLRTVTDAPADETVGAWRLTRSWRAGRFPLTIFPSHFLATTIDGRCTYNARGIVYGEHLTFSDDTPASELVVPGETVETTAPAADDVRATPPTTPEETSVTQTPGNDDLAAKIAALKAELEAEAAVEAQGTAASAATEPTLAELAQQVRDTPVPQTLTDKTFRLLVATDWTSATVPLAVLTAYASMFAANAPVELVFAVPHEPTQADLDAVSVLFEGLEDVEDTAALQIEKFDEATTKACYAAIIPTGDQNALIMELCVFFTQMHRLAEVVTDATKLAEEPAPADGFNAGLSRRLGEFVNA